MAEIDTVQPRSAPRSKDGQLWKKRVRKATQRRDRALHDFVDLRNLYTTVYEQRERWGVSIPIGRTLVDAVVGDTYVRNPDPFIQSRTPALDDPDRDRKARDLSKTIHDETKTQQIMQRGMVVTSYGGVAGHWTDFQQESYYENVDITDEEGAVVDAAGNADLIDAQPSAAGPLRGPRPIVRAKKQRVTAALLMPHEFLVDYDCNNWDLSDAKWIAREYALTLEEFEQRARDGYYDANQVAKLRNWIGNQGQRRNGANGGIDSYTDEKDPAYRMVWCWEIWSRVEKMIYHVPVGADFHIGKYPWPDAWADADEYPLTIISFNWQPPDQWGNGGFYGLPDLRLVRSPLENLPRLEALYLDSCTNFLRKHLSVKGLLSSVEKAEFQTDKNHQWIDVDLDLLAKKFNSGQPIDLMQLDFKKLIYSVKDDDKAEALKHLEAIEHELDLIYKLMGVGPSERAGIAENKSATDSLGIQQRLAARTEKRVEEGADICDVITKKQFIVLKAQATLPIRYLRVAGLNEQSWDSFPAEELWDLDVVIKHHVGSSRPPTRETEKAERRELFSLAAPVLQALGASDQVLEWLWWVAVPYDKDFADRMLRPDLSAEAEDIVLLLAQVKDGAADIDPKITAQLLNKLGGFLQGYLGDARLQRVAQRQVQQAGSNAPAPAASRGSGSLAKPKTQGAAAATRAAAASGAVGGRR